MVVIALVAALTAVAACRQRTPGPEGDILATLTGAPINVEAFDAKTMRDKPSLVLFVTPTCPHCAAQLPQAQHAATKSNANLVAVFVAGKKENATGVLDHAKFSAPAILDDGSLKRRYGIRSVPYTLVLGADGKAREQFVGEQTAGMLMDALEDAR
ncbi:MAG: TlpA family protein disulfide reductase [Kofleriaceae bacterium]